MPEETEEVKVSQGVETDIHIDGYLIFLNVHFEFFVKCFRFPQSYNNQIIGRNIEE